MNWNTMKKDKSYAWIQCFYTSLYYDWVSLGIILTERDSLRDVALYLQNANIFMNDLLFLMKNLYKVTLQTFFTFNEF